MGHCHVALSKLGFEEGVPGRKRTQLPLHAVTDNAERPLQDSNDAGQKVCRYWRTIIHAQGSVLPYNIAWEVNREEFEEPLATKRESAPDPDGLPYGAFRCAGGIGTRFLQRASQQVKTC